MFSAYRIRIVSDNIRIVFILNTYCLNDCIKESTIGVVCVKELMVRVVDSA